MFTDGKDIYKKYKYKPYNKGFVILGPPGIGKTYFVNHQPKNRYKKGWVDQDDLFDELGVKWQENLNNEVDFRLNYLRANYMLEQSRALGYRIIGSLFWPGFIPDAIVIPNLKDHLILLKKRKDLDVETVKEIRNILKDIAKKNKVKIFKKIEKAIEYLKNK